MLQDVFIKNFAIIDELTINFESQCSTLTGETGAGKSIVLQAIDLALGGRGNSEIVKSGEKTAQVSLQFDVSQHPEIKQWLVDKELDSDNECIIRRTIGNDGKSRSFINATPTTLQTIKQLASQLINIHGQHDNQLLLKTQAQTTIVDSYAGNQTLLAQLKENYQQWRTVNQEYTALKSQLNESKERASYIKYQLDEFEKANLTENDIVSLPSEHKRLCHGEELLQHYQHAMDTLLDNEPFNVVNALSEALEAVRKSKQHDQVAESSEALINEALVLCQEAYQNINGYRQAIDCDPQQLQQLEARISTIHDLARKHRAKPEELITIFKSMKEEYESLTHIDSNLSTLELKRNELEKNYQQLANKLSKKRLQAARKLEKMITEQIQQLGMPKAIFSIAFINREQNTPAANGLESIEFQVATNPGAKAQAMHKIASGGELSRISLAIQVITAQHIHIPTLFFDEVDVGIGGATAAVVGKMLRQLGNSHQVICITHQPQVAASGHQQLHVQKSTGKNNTSVAIAYLSGNKRVDEIARMLGGLKITKQTTAHAKELVELQQE